MNAIPDGYLKDAKGRLVPESLVKPAELLIDQTVRKCIHFARDLNAQIARFRGHSFDDIGTLMSLLAEQYGASKGGAKGNVTLMSYDGTLKVQLQVADFLVFGPELQVARALIDECIAEWGEGARPELRALIDRVFATDKEGQVSREAIFSLRRVEIEDARWQRAMEAIADAVRMVGSKEYLRFYERDTPESAWRPITIDLAAAAPVKPAGRACPQMEGGQS